MKSPDGNVTLDRVKVLQKLCITFISWSGGFNQGCGAAGEQTEPLTCAVAEVNAVVRLYLEKTVVVSRDV